MNAMKVKGLNGLNGLISLGVTWSIPDPYRYVMFIFNFSAVSCTEAVELLLCPEKKREYADVVQLYLHQCWAEVVHDAPYCVAVQSKAGQMPLGV
ncbi:hypothetical protein T4D_12398 [Trichinella pseudospiralis]|uniref:Uncharacterized protein n=1 Tax=Trichinella pseudospiralis TaxID=6337 RepID=A0A0V1F606_TRIPS|nr:hypothetical protein T4D_12398 [Trichinella pseudospiralis]